MAGCRPDRCPRPRPASATLNPLSAIPAEPDSTRAYLPSPGRAPTEESLDLRRITQPPAADPPHRGARSIRIRAAPVNFRSSSRASASRGWAGCSASSRATSTRSRTTSSRRAVRSGVTWPSRRLADGRHRPRPQRIDDSAGAQSRRTPAVRGRAAARSRYVSSMMTDALARLEALPDVLTLRELAAVLRCSESTIKRRIHARVFPIPRLRGLDKRLRFAATAVRRYLEENGRARTPRT